MDLRAFAQTADPARLDQIRRLIDADQVHRVDPRNLKILVALLDDDEHVRLVAQNASRLDRNGAFALTTTRIISAVSRPTLATGAVAVYDTWRLADVEALELRLGRTWADLHLHGKPELVSSVDHGRTPRNHDLGSTYARLAPVAVARRFAESVAEAGVPTRVKIDGNFRRLDVGASRTDGSTERVRQLASELAALASTTAGVRDQLLALKRIRPRSLRPIVRRAIDAAESGQLIANTHENVLLTDVEWWRGYAAIFFAEDSKALRLHLFAWSLVRLVGAIDDQPVAYPDDLDELARLLASQPDSAIRAVIEIVNSVQTRVTAVADERGSCLGDPLRDLARAIRTLAVVSARRSAPQPDSEVAFLESAVALTSAGTSALDALSRVLQAASQ